MVVRYTSLPHFRSIWANKNHVFVRTRESIFGRFGLKKSCFRQNSGGDFRSIWAKKIMLSLELGNRFSVDLGSKNHVFVRSRVSIFGFRTPFRFFVCSFVRLFVRSFVFVNINLTLTLTLTITQKSVLDRKVLRKCFKALEPTPKLSKV